MKIIIKSRQEIEALSNKPFSNRTALISITDVNDFPVKLTNHPEFLIRVSFDDVDNDVIVDEVRGRGNEDEIKMIEEKYHMFTDNIANEIAKFYLSHCDKTDLLICQCEHGQSRSAAIAAAILEFRARKGIIVFSDDRYYPNKVVFRKLLRALNAEFINTNV